MFRGKQDYRFFHQKSKVNYPLKNSFPKMNKLS